MTEMEEVRGLKRVATLPAIGRVLLMPYRARAAWPHVTAPWRKFLPWLVRSREYTNFTYGLDPLNAQYLAAFVAEITGVSFEIAAGYIAELEQDTQLRAHIQQRIRASAERCFADLDVFYGRRAGWYAVVRTAKPRVVVETGVDKGLGACVLTAALRQNAIEGFPGRYYGTDINPTKGALLSGEYAEYGSIIYGDSVASLREFGEKIDIFINDSDHSSEYEAMEYQVVQPKLSPQAIVLGDNADITDQLLRFSLSTGRRFQFFREQPLNHWFPGGGIGAAFFAAAGPGA